MSSVPGIRVTCDYDPDDDTTPPCDARLFVDGAGSHTKEQIRVYVAERGWSSLDDGDFCPSHRREVGV